MGSPTLLLRKKIALRLFILIYAVAIGITVVLILWPRRMWGVMILLGLGTFRAGNLVGLKILPHLTSVGDKIRPANGEEKTRLETLCEEHGIIPIHVWVVTRPQRFVHLAFGGIVPPKYDVLVDIHFFETYSATEREALFTMMARRYRNYYEPYRYVTPVLLFGLYLLVNTIAGAIFSSDTVSMLNQFYVLEIAFLMAFFVVSHFGQRIVYESDLAAAERTSPETVAGVIEHAVTEVQGTSLEQNWLLELLRMDPSPHKRIQRLQEEQPQ